MDNSKIIHELSSFEIQWFDEISLDKKAADETLKIALMVHMNRGNEIRKQARKFWEHISEVSGIDTSKKKYVVDTVGGKVVVVESDDGDDTGDGRLR